MVVRQALVLTIVLAAASTRASGPVVAASSVDDPRFSAILIPDATLSPPPLIDNLPKPLCNDAYCPLDLSGLQDSWKRDFIKKTPEHYLNADTILVARAHFAQDVRQFGDPHAPAVAQYKIESLGVCFGGYIGGEGLGIRSC